MLKSLAKLFGGAWLAFVWVWVMFEKVPVLLTSGTLPALLAFTLIVLCVGVPVLYIGNKIRAKLKEQPK
jgi:hypothetical protein